MVTGSLITAVLTAATDVAHRRGVSPAVLRCHPSVQMTLFREDDAARVHLHELRPLAVIGITVDVDPWLPDGVWRLCDQDATLLYDSREGTTP